MSCTFRLPSPRYPHHCFFFLFAPSQIFLLVLPLSWTGENNTVCTPPRLHPALTRNSPIYISTIDRSLDTWVSRTPKLLRITAAGPAYTEAARSYPGNSIEPLARQVPYRTFSKSRGSRGTASGPISLHRCLDLSSATAFSHLPL